MVRPSRIARGAALAVALALWALPAEADNVIGNSCTSVGQSGNSARYADGNNEWCNGSTWQYPAYQFGSSSASCNSSTQGGIVQWTGSFLEGCNGASWVTLAGLPNVSTYCTVASGLSCTGNSGASWSNSSAYTMVDVYICGGGGQGGGGGLCASGSNCSGGGGGGGGECVEQIFRASDLSSTVTVTLGSGGSGNTGDTNGANGGTSTFGSYLTGYGGGGGAVRAAPATPPAGVAEALSPRGQTDHQVN